MPRAVFLPFLPLAFATNCFDIQDDTRYSGAVIEPIIDCASEDTGCTRSECCDFCRKEEQCIAYAEVEQAHGQCWLFSSVSGTIGDALNWRSGNYTRPTVTTTTTTTTTTAGSSTSSTAGSGTTSTEGPSTTSTAGSSTTSHAGSSTTPHAGSSTTSKAGSSTTPHAGPTTTSKAGPSTTSTASPAACPCTGDAGDCTALRDLYAALSPKDTALSSWCKEGTEDPCSWATSGDSDDVYIGCSPAPSASPLRRERQLTTAGRVTTLRVRNSELKGTIPESVGDLSELRDLDLSNNGISGAIPASLAGLAHLQRLELGHNELSSFPESLCDLVGRMSSDCGLQGNDFASPPRCATTCGVPVDRPQAGWPVIVAVIAVLAVLLCLAALFCSKFRKGGGGGAHAAPLLDDIPGGDFALTDEAPSSGPHTMEMVQTPTSAGAGATAGVAIIPDNAITGNNITGNAVTGNAITGVAITDTPITGVAIIPDTVITGSDITGVAITDTPITGAVLTDAAGPTGSPTGSGGGGTGLRSF